MELSVLKEANEAIDRNVDSVEALLDEIIDGVIECDNLTQGAVNGCVNEIRSHLRDILKETLTLKIQYKYK